MYKEEVDILETISSLNNHEVFTPPKVARSMLDLLPQEVWSNPALKFLDPCAKTGVFLREIMFRLNKSLPRLNKSGGDFYYIYDKDGKNSKSYNLNNDSQRLLHIRRNMLFGIGTSDLTGKLSRRTLYGVMIANKDKDEILLNKDKDVDTDYKGLNSTYDYRMWDDCCANRQRDGNIFHGHNKPQHRFDKNDKCIDCGMGKDYSESENDENYAYPFIHENVSVFIQDIRSGKMKFDVIIGNPPYQISDSGHAASAKPIYHKFIELSILLSPKYITMITPSRWMTGGKGLDKFRKKMLNDKRISHIVDFKNSFECFPSVSIEGGVSFFLWNREHRDSCLYVDANNEKTSLVHLNRYNTMVRNIVGINVIEKVMSSSQCFLSDTILSRKPFGLSTFFKEYSAIKKPGYIGLFGNKKLMKDCAGFGYVKASVVQKNNEVIPRYKVLVPAARGRSSSVKQQVLGNPIFCPPQSICSETYIVVGSYDSEYECNNMISYVKTKFFRFMVSLKKETQHASQLVYGFVPHLPMSQEWSDEKLYKKYNLTQEEISHIESSIKEML